MATSSERLDRLTTCRLGPEGRHVWNAISGWVGRYRCYCCGAIGRRDAVVSDLGRGETIVHYVCNRTACDAPAVRQNPQLCREHVDALARKTH